MQEFDLPKLPDGCQYGAEASFPLPKDGEFHAPAGFAIKRIDSASEVVICVPIQQWVPALETWCTISG